MFFQIRENELFRKFELCESLKREAPFLRPTDADITAKT
jgi:hypothetical protein